MILMDKKVFLALEADNMSWLPYNKWHELFVSTIVWSVRKAMAWYVIYTDI